MTVLLVVRSKQQHMMLFSPLAVLAHSTRSDPLAPKEVLAYPLINPPPTPAPFSVLTVRPTPDSGPSPAPTEATGGRSPLTYRDPPPPRTESESVSPPVEVDNNGRRSCCCCC